jgi:hypothetical protein
MTKQLDDFRRLSTLLNRTYPTAPSLCAPEATAKNTVLCASELQTYLNRSFLFHNTADHSGFTESPANRAACSPSGWATAA